MQQFKIVEDGHKAVKVWIITERSMQKVKVVSLLPFCGTMIMFPVIR